MAINARSASESLAMFGLKNGNEPLNVGGLGASIKGVTTADQYERTPKPTKASKVKKQWGKSQSEQVTEEALVPAVPESPLKAKLAKLWKYAPALDEPGIDAILFLMVERLQLQEAKRNVTPDSNERNATVTNNDNSVTRYEPVTANVTQSMSNAERQKAYRLRKAEEKKERDKAGE